MTLFTGCGSGGEDSELRLRCGDGTSFCVTSCNLGCTLGGCTLTNISENQPLTFIFNQDVDPAAVNFSSISISTVNGEPARGQFVVQGKKVEFLPSISVVNGLTEFGFRRNETYILNLGGEGSSNPVRSTSGDPLGTSLKCTLVASGGIIDFDGKAPRVVDMVPAPGSEDVGVNSSIVITFSEIIDMAPFQGGTTATVPIKYNLKPTRVSSSGGRECDVGFPAILAEGVPQASVIQFQGHDVTQVVLQPVIPLPGGSCVEIVITNGVRDLAGNSAETLVSRFLTEPLPGGEKNVTENYQNAAKQNPDLSSGIWGGGVAIPGRIGWDGRHGPFDPIIGTPLGNDVFVFSTDSIQIPARLTPSAQPFIVTDGQFYFEEFVLPANFTIRFEGSNPARIFVMGRVQIDGRIECNARTMTVFPARNSQSTVLVPGQPGGIGGAGGGSGGLGADRCKGNGPTFVGGINTNEGRPGEDLPLPSGHAYVARAVDTGGRGSGLWPTSGKNLDVKYTSNFVFSGMMQSGGGGGGWSGPGAKGQVTLLPPGASLSQHAGPDTDGGLLFDPFPIPSGASSLDHFLIGGSGGGGGGSHTFLAISGAFNDTWRAGGGGSGGGGAVAVRAGGNLTVSSTGVIEAKGGEGAIFSDANLVSAAIPNFQRAYPAPGGGGSGGSVVLQAQGNLAQAGLLDTSGGVGSKSQDVFPPNLQGKCHGGDGNPGFVRVEVPGGLTNAGQTIPPATGANVGSLSDEDERVGDISKFYSTGLVFPPLYKRYEIDMDDGSGTVVTYSDDPAFGSPLDDPNGPVTVLFQGAQVSAITGLPDPTSLGFWRSKIADMNSDSATGFRYRFSYNRAVFPNTKIHRLALIYEN